MTRTALSSVTRRVERLVRLLTEPAWGWGMGTVVIEAQVHQARREAEALLAGLKALQARNEADAA